MGLGFLNIHKASQENIILPRLVWVEIRGLPIIAWSRENFTSIVQSKGSIIGIDQVLHEDYLLCNPRVLLETYSQEALSWESKVVLGGKEFSIFINECFAGKIEEDPRVVSNKSDADGAVPFQQVAVVEVNKASEKIAADHETNTIYFSDQGESGEVEAVSFQRVKVLDADNTTVKNVDDQGDNKDYFSNQGNSDSEILDSECKDILTERNEQIAGQINIHLDDIGEEHTGTVITPQVVGVGLSI